MRMLVLDKNTFEHMVKASHNEIVFLDYVIVINYEAGIFYYAKNRYNGETEKQYSIDVLKDHMECIETIALGTNIFSRLLEGDDDDE